MQLLTVPEVAKRLRVGECTVWRLLQAGQLKAVDVSISPASKRPRKRITEKHLEEFIAERSNHGSTS